MFKKKKNGAELKSIRWGNFAALGSVAVVTALSVVGCSPTKNTAVETVSQKQADQLASQGHTQEAAAQYARIGELLLIPEGIGYADQMFDKALSVDPNNGKANFYSAITKPLMAMQGFITRLEPIADENQAQQLQRIRDQISQLNLPELTRFATELPDGKKAFGSYHDVQRAERTELLPVILDSAAKIARISTQKPLELLINLSRLNVNQYSYPSDYQEYSYCQQSSSDSQGNWTCTNTVTVQSYFYGADPKPTRVSVDPIDLKVLTGAYMAAADYLRAGTAYSVEGLEGFMKRYNAVVAVDGAPSAGDLVSLIKQYPSLGTLESDNELVELGRSAEDVLKHALDLAAMQNELCGNDGRNASNSLFKSICISVQDAEQMQLAADLLAGPKKVEIGMGPEGTPVRILVDVNSFLANPPKDLKALLPTSFDDAGRPTSFPDATMGGLFPNGDLLDALRQIGRIE